jgi:hypothetical protein
MVAALKPGYEAHSAFRQKLHEINGLILRRSDSCCLGARKAA